MKELLPEKLEKYVPAQLSIDGFKNMIYRIKTAKKQFERLRKSYNDMNKSFESYKFQAHSNNWLKMHGYPMRCKGRKGSKKS